MNTELAPCLAVLLVLAIVTQPVRSAPTRPVGATPGLIMAADVLPDVADQRRQVESQLVELGRAADEAASLADQLTEADLIVLGANPQMMQEAGNSLFWTLLIGALLIAGLVAIAASSNGSVSIFGD